MIPYPDISISTHALAVQHHGVASIQKNSPKLSRIKQSPITCSVLCRGSRQRICYKFSHFQTQASALFFLFASPAPSQESLYPTASLRFNADIFLFGVTYDFSSLQRHFAYQVNAAIPFFPPSRPAFYTTPVQPISPPDCVQHEYCANTSSLCKSLCFYPKVIFSVPQTAQYDVLRTPLYVTFQFARTPRTLFSLLKRYLFPIQTNF